MSFMAANKVSLSEARFEVALREAVQIALTTGVSQDLVIVGLRYTAAEIEEADANVRSPASTAEDALAKAVRDQARGDTGAFDRRSAALGALGIGPGSYEKSADGEDEVAAAPGVGPEWERPVRGDAHREATDNRFNEVNLTVVADTPGSEESGDPSDDMPI